MNVPLLVAGFTFLAVFLATSAVFLYVNSREVLQTWRRRADGTPLEKDPTSETVTEQLMAQLHAVLEWFAKLNQPSNVEEAKATRRQLITAGYRSKKASVLFIGSKLLLAVIETTMIALVPVKYLGFPTFSNLVFYYVLAAGCGYYAPVIWLKMAIAKRKDALQRAIPDALDLMVVCVEAGLGLDQAIARVAEEVQRTHPALSDELNLLSMELRTGVSRQEALRNLAYRTDMEEVRNLVALLVQTDRFGTSIAQALRVHSDAMRSTRRLKAEEMAAKLPVELLFPLIFFIFPSMFIVLIGPACIQMVRVLFPAMNGQ
jgi:tight adherence protein C